MKAPQTPLSKKLRKKQTPWEAKLWKHLRGKRFEGNKFKRQVPIGSYIVDFCCQRKKLIVEADGGHHSEYLNQSKDKIRQKDLESRGYTVLRFWNNEIDANIEGILEIINKHLINNLSPIPSPNTGEGRSKL